MHYFKTKIINGAFGENAKNNEIYQRVFFQEKFLIIKE